MSTKYHLNVIYQNEKENILQHARLEIENYDENVSYEDNFCASVLDICDSGFIIVNKCAIPLHMILKFDSIQEEVKIQPQSKPKSSRNYKKRRKPPRNTK